MSSTRKFRIYNTHTGEYEAVYDRSYREETHFESHESARQANCHGTYLDREKYQVHEVLVTETIVNIHGDKQ